MCHDEHDQIPALFTLFTDYDITYHFCERCEESTAHVVRECMEIDIDYTDVEVTWKTCTRCYLTTRVEEEVEESGSIVDGHIVWEDEIEPHAFLSVFRGFG